MSKGSIAIKVLRENFIKKHQVNPDYFTLAERPVDQEAFSDKDMFRHLEFQRKNNHHGHGKLNKRKEQHKQPQLKLHIRAQTQRALKIVPMSRTPVLTKDEDDNYRVAGGTPTAFSNFPCQPSFVKTQKLRRKVVSARQPRRPLPKYSAYIMKPCNVAQAKIQPRPQSAITRRKSQELNKYMGFGLRRQQQSERAAKNDHLYLLPWQTEYDEI